MPDSSADFIWRARRAQACCRGNEPDANIMTVPDGNALEREQLLAHRADAA